TRGNVPDPLRVLRHPSRPAQDSSSQRHDEPELNLRLPVAPEAFPFDSAPRFIIFDRDSKFGGGVLRTIKALGIEPIRTSFRSPWQNGTAGRWVASARRDLLDRVIVLNEQHLRRLLRGYLRDHHQDRCHLSLSKDCPSPRKTNLRPSCDASIVALPRVGGLYHRYQWREAA
ncbi:MAG: hypothetical protein JSV80_18300, partial [Acidobacteriota bacterium]